MNKCTLILAVAALLPPSSLSAAPPSPPSLSPSTECYKSADGDRWQTPPRVATKDPTMAVAERMKTRIEAKEREVAQDEEAAFQMIEDAIHRISDDGLQAQLETLEGFRQVTAIEAKLARDLLQNRNKFVEDHDALLQMYAKAVPVFRSAAKVFSEEYAATEPYAELQEDYRTWANTWLLIADTLEKRSARGPDENKELAESLNFLERAALFLDRLHEALKAMPDIMSLAEREKNVQRLREFIKCFERTRNLLQQLNTELKANALAADLRSTKQTGPTTSIASLASLKSIVCGQGQPCTLRTAGPATIAPLLLGGCALVLKRRRRARAGHANGPFQASNTTISARRKVAHHGWFRTEPSPIQDEIGDFLSRTARNRLATGQQGSGVRPLAR